MENSLHRQLKALYAGEAAACEVVLGGYRIDAIAKGRLFEIQCASLAAIRPKIRDLLASHKITVVKPLAARKLLIRRATKDGPIVTQRLSPRRESMADLFADMVHFVDVFPHPNLIIEVLLTEQEEHRLTRPVTRRRRKDFDVIDRFLAGVGEKQRLKSAADLFRLLPAVPESPFSTADLALTAGIPRWLAQKAAYCLRKSGAVQIDGKKGNAILYRRSSVTAKTSKSA